MKGENKTLKFELSKRDVKIKELLQGDFLGIEVYAISDEYPNNNDSTFTVESLYDAIPTCVGKPALGAFNTEIGPLGDFEAHNDNGLKYDPELDELYEDYTSSDSEIPLGYIRNEKDIEVVTDEKGLHWLKFTAVLWCRYNYQAIKSLLKSRKGSSKISVEIEVLDSEYDEKGVEVIKKFSLLGFTILGAKVKEGINNAHLSVLDYLENKLFSRKQKALAFAYSALDNYNNGEKVEKDTINIVDTATVNDFEQTFEENNIINENPQEEVNMESPKEISEEGVNVKLNLTMREKMELLEGYMRDKCIQMSDESKECVYLWVQDIDDDFVYFEYNEVKYRAPYSISDELEDKVMVNFEDKERVVRTWTVFAENAENEALTSNEEIFEKADNFAAGEDGSQGVSEKFEELCPICGQYPCVCESKEDEACGDKQDEACGDKQDEACGSKEDEACGDKQDEACGITIHAADNEDVCPECGQNPCVCEKANCEALRCSSMEEMAAEDSAPQEVSEEQEPTNTFESKEDTIMVSYNGEQYSIEDFVQKYEDAINSLNETTNSLNEMTIACNEATEKFNKLTKEIEEEKAAKFAEELSQIGVDFVSNDGNIDENSKKQFVSQIKEKCVSKEFVEKEDVMKFAKQLVAMYYFDNGISSNTKKDEFSVSITKQHQDVKKSEKLSELKDAVNKLQHV